MGSRSLPTENISRLFLKFAAAKVANLFMLINTFKALKVYFYQLSFQVISNANLALLM